MQKLITKYGLAAHLALLAVAPLFLSPFFAIDTIARVSLYLSFLTFAWFLAAPSRLQGENSYMARRRVFKGIFVDPFVWILAVVILVSVVRCLNSGVDLAYDAENYVWFMSEAAASFLPASHGDGAFFPFVTSISVFLVAIVAFHALGRSARYAFLYIVGLFSGIAALIHLYHFSIGEAEFLELSKCSLDSAFYLGFGYALSSAFLTAALSVAFERRWNVAIVTVPVLLGAELAAMLIFSPVYVSLVSIAVSLSIVVYSVIWGRKYLSRSGELKLLALFFISLALAYMIVYLIDRNDFSAKVYALTNGFVGADYREVSDKLSAVAFKVWRENIWLGTGVDTFAFDIRFNLADADWLVVSQDQRVPLNAWWYILAERGVIGMLFVAVPLAFTVFAYVSRLFCASRKLPAPVVLLGPLVLIATIALGFFNCSVFSAGMMSLVIAAMLISAASFVKEKKDGE